MRLMPSRRRPMSLPVAALVAAAGTVISISSIAWAIRAVLNVG